MIIKTCTLDSATRRKDRSISIRLTTTTEQGNNAIAELDRLFQQVVVVAIKDSEYTEPELNDIDELDMDIYDKPKSPSQRLRNVLYLLHKQVSPEIEFREFYTSKMEAIIEFYKDKLD